MSIYNLNSCDTDAIKIYRKDGGVICDTDIRLMLDKLNALTPELIELEFDGYYTDFLIVKAKNYVSVDNEGNCIIKGSGLRASMKEPALKKFINEIIAAIIGHGDIPGLYNGYAKQIKHLADISEWCSKKTVTKAVLKPNRTNEKRVLDAIGRTPVTEGDKIHVFFETPEKLTLLQEFNGAYSKEKLYEKLFKTAKIFEQVVDISMLPNYKLKRHGEIEGKL